MTQKLLLFVFLLFSMSVVFAQADFKINGSLCQDNPLRFIDASVVADSYSWTFGDGNTSNEQNPTHAYTDSGTYTIRLTITVATSNFNTEKTIYISKNPVAHFLVDTTKYASYSRIFTDSSELYNPFNKNIWTFGDGSAPIEIDTTLALYKYPESGTYTVWMTVIDSKGCLDSIDATVDVYDLFKVPNVFTPNADHINDQFIVTSNGKALFSIEIYSRWGNLVFKKSGQEQIIWDGRLPDGNLVKPGTYYYVITPEDASITYESEQGFITVFY